MLSSATIWICHQNNIAERQLERQRHSVRNDFRRLVSTYREAKQQRVELWMCSVQLLTSLRERELELESQESMTIRVLPVA
jgi:hypothetical protein